MFKRRDKLNFLGRLCSWIWPKGGWTRATRYISLRLARMPGTSYSIAAGFACGAAMSFTPFVGTHLIWSGLLAWIVRGNIIVSLLGTVVGNPWTFPFIWVWLYESGNWLLAQNRHGTNAPHPDFYSTFTNLADALLRFDMGRFIDSAIPVVWPMFVSSIPTAFVVWFAFFFPMKKMIDGYQRRRRKRWAKVRARHAEKEPALAIAEENNKEQGATE